MLRSRVPFASILIGGGRCSRVVSDVRRRNLLSSAESARVKAPGARVWCCAADRERRMRRTNQLQSGQPRSCRELSKLRARWGLYEPLWAC